MERFSGKVAVVTGSSAGIGAAICKKLVKHGVIVIGLARRTEKLEVLSKELSERAESSVGKFHSLKCDVTSETEVKNSFRWILSAHGPITILINNAGILGNCFWNDSTVESISKTFDTNVTAAILCSKEVIQSMTDNSIQGHIINIDSIAAHSVLGGDYGKFLIYRSSKHALKIISEGLRREMISKNLDIKVTNLSPGSVYTEVTSKLFPSFYSSKKILEPDDISDACMAVLSTPPNVLISELIILPIHQEFTPVKDNA